MTFVYGNHCKFFKSSMKSGNNTTEGKLENLEAKLEDLNARFEENSKKFVGAH